MKKNFEYYKSEIKQFLGGLATVTAILLALVLMLPNKIYNYLKNKKQIK